MSGRARRCLNWRAARRRRWIIVGLRCHAGMRWAESLRRSKSLQAMVQALVSSPTTSAKRAWRSSKVQNFWAFNSSAQATCSESSVRTPMVGAKRRASLIAVSHAFLGSLPKSRFQVRNPAETRTMHGRPRRARAFCERRAGKFRERFQPCGMGSSKLWGGWRFAEETR